MNNIYDIVSQVVDSIRNTDVIISITETSAGVYVFTTNDIQQLDIGDYVTITNTTGFDNTDAKIVAINTQNNTFTINAASGIVPSTFGTWKANKPYYLFGHYKEIAQTLTEKGASNTFKYQRYPLIALFLDVNENVNTDVESNTQSAVSLNLAIIESTKSTYKAGERLELIFKTKLYPIYEKLFVGKTAAFRNPQLFNIHLHSPLPHTKIDSFFLGSESRNQNVLNDFCDAIEIRNLQLNIKNTANIC